MRTWLKVSLWGVALAVLAFAALAGTGAYYFLRHLETGSAVEADTLKEFDTIRAKYGSREPLIALIKPEAGDIKITRAAHPQGVRASTIHVLTWTAEDGDRMRADLPLWLMRFSSVNILSRLGVAPDKFRLTVEDVARYGPGVIADYRRPGHSHALIWVE
jgi:hypothetical protein